MPSAPFVSSAARAEDVVIARAFARTPQPRYLEIVRSPGAPDRCAALRACGWAGRSITHEPGLDASTWPAETVHALLIDPELELRTTEMATIAALDPTTRQPWLVLAPSPAAVSLSDPPDPQVLTPLLDAGYRPGLFDGVTQYLVAPAHLSEILSHVDHPAGPQDDYVTAEQDALASRVRALESERDELRAASDAMLRDLVQWRARALEAWSSVAASGRRRGSAGVDADYEALADELDAIRSTLSWRITRPLRAVRTTSLRTSSLRKRGPVA